MTNPSVPATITIDGTTYRVGADLKLLSVRGSIRMTRRRALLGPNGGTGELIEFSDGSWRLIDSRGATRSKGPQPGVVDRPRARTSETNRVTQALLEAWLAGAQHIAVERHNEHFPTLAHPILSIAPRGRRYAKIIEGDDPRGRRVWAFIDLSNGDVLKPHGWDAPAEGARGNLFDRWQGLRFLDWTGPFYLDAVNSILAADRATPATSNTPATPPDGAAAEALQGLTAGRTRPPELILRPGRRVRTVGYRVFQAIGGAEDGTLRSVRLDEGGELTPGDERDELERAIAAGTLRELGTREEESIEWVDGRWMCTCGVIGHFTDPEDDLRCASCGAEHRVDELAPSGFTVCAYCQGPLPEGADRHWHQACIEAARAKRPRVVPKKRAPGPWDWQGRRKS